MTPQEIANSNPKTYRELLELLKKMPDEMLDCNISIELTLSEEVLGTSSDSVRFDLASDCHDVLDENHPVFVVDF